MKLPKVTRKRDVYRLALMIAGVASAASVVLVLAAISLFAQPALLEAAPNFRAASVGVAVISTLIIALPIGAVLANELLKAHELGESMRTAALIDPLTGLANRAAVLQLIRDAMETCCSTGQTGALLYIDLDHFKAINDQFGHSGGDAALQHAAQIMRETINPDMILGRFGGEEFVCFSSNAAAAAATALAIIVALRATSVNHYGSDIEVTASVGIAVMGDANTPEALLANADRALYLAKSAGRDRVVHHEDIRLLESVAAREPSAKAREAGNERQPEAA